MWRRRRRRQWARRPSRHHGGNLHRDRSRHFGHDDGNGHGLPHCRVAHTRIKRPNRATRAFSRDPHHQGKPQHVERTLPKTCREAASCPVWGRRGFLVCPAIVARGTSVFIEMSKFEWKSNPTNVAPDGQSQCPFAPFGPRPLPESQRSLRFAELMDIGVVINI